MFRVHTLFSSLVFFVALLVSSVAWAGGWLGITIKPPQGVQVAEIFKESPADRSAIKKGDVIKRINGIVIRSPEHFIKTVIGFPAGKEITLDILRQGHAVKLNVTLEDNEEHYSIGQGLANRWSVPAPGSLQSGYTLPTFGEKSSITDGMGRAFPGRRESYLPSEGRGYIPPQERLFRLSSPVPSAWLGIATGMSTDGVVVMGVAPNSPAQQAELKVGDVITAINRQPILLPEDLVRVLTIVKPDDLAEISFSREGKLQMLQVQLQKPPTPPVENPGER